jgi:hypothetical protein
MERLERPNKNEYWHSFAGTPVFKQDDYIAAMEKYCDWLEKNNADIVNVRLSLPSETDIDNALEGIEYINYKNGFVNPETQVEVDMIKSGAKWLLNKLKGNEA